MVHLGLGVLGADDFPHLLDRGVVASRQTSGELPREREELADHDELVDGELLGLVAVEVQGASLRVGEGALLRPSPRDPSMAVAYIEGSDLPDPVAFHVLRNGLPQETKPVPLLLQALVGAELIPQVLKLGLVTCFREELGG